MCNFRESLVYETGRIDDSGLGTQAKQLVR